MRYNELKKIRKNIFIWLQSPTAHCEFLNILRSYYDAILYALFSRNSKKVPLLRKRVQHCPVIKFPDINFQVRSLRPRFGKNLYDTNSE